MIFNNPAGAPELACDECGCRWFDRMANTCYECGSEVTPENLAEIRQALEKFEARKQARPEHAVTRPSMSIDARTDVQLEEPKPT